MIDFACKKFDVDDIVKCSLGLTKSDFKLLAYLIENSGEFATTDELADSLKLNLSTVQRGVKKLSDKGMLLRSQENLNGGGYAFMYKVKRKDAMRKVIIDIIENWKKKVESELKTW